jgi:hypothetical protein
MLGVRRTKGKVATAGKRPGRLPGGGTLALGTGTTGP